MPDREAACAAAEASVGNEGAFLTHVHRFDVAGGIEHLLHTRTAFGTFVCDDHTVALLHFASEDAFAGVFLTVEDHSWSLEVPKTRVNTCRLHYAAVLSDVAEEDSHTAVLHVGVLDVTDATVLAVGVKRLPMSVL